MSVDWTSRSWRSTMASAVRIQALVASTPSSYASAAAAWTTVRPAAAPTSASDSGSAAPDISSPCRLWRGWRRVSAAVYRWRSCRDLQVCVTERAWRYASFVDRWEDGSWRHDNDKREPATECKIVSRYDELPEYFVSRGEIRSRNHRPSRVPVGSFCSCARDRNVGSRICRDQSPGNKPKVSFNNFKFFVVRKFILTLSNRLLIKSERIHQRF